MDWVPWNDTLKTGHATMDVDHNALAGLFNRLAEAVEKRKGNDFYGKLLDDIIQQVRTHFAAEEQLMAERHYPKSEEHRAEHAMLLGQALDYRGSFAVIAQESPDLLAHFPEVWLAFHILFSDKDLAEFLARSA